MFPTRTETTEARWPRAVAESALIVKIPEAEASLCDFRKKHDPAAAAGLPAHVTILYPFKSPHDLGEHAMQRLRDALNGRKPFDYSFREIRRFPGVIYLAPDEDQPFRDLIERIRRAFPETPPYEGRHSDVIPHLTVAQMADEAKLDELERELASTMRDGPPIRGRATELTLIDNLRGPWYATTAFRFDDGSTDLTFAAE